MPSWWDRFGQEWASSGLTDDPTFAQGDAGWAFIGQAPPTVEQFNSMFQWSDDKDNWLYGQVANCIIGSGQAPASNNLMQLWNAIKSLQRRKLDQDTAFYVDAINGNDLTGTGILGSPWKTVNHAINYIYTYIDIAGRNCVIQLAPGTYDPISHYQSINGNLIVQGDPLNPRAYLIKAVNGTAIYCTAGAIMFVRGLSVEGTGTVGDYNTFGIGLLCDRSGIILFSDIAFGPCTFSHMYAAGSGNIYPANNAATNYSIYGGATYHIYCVLSGAVTIVSNHITITGNPNFSGAFITSTSSGYVQCWSMVATGTVVGKKYLVNAAGILTAGGQANTIIPGTIAGTVDAVSFGLLF